LVKKQPKEKILDYDLILNNEFNKFEIFQCRKKSVRLKHGSGTYAGLNIGKIGKKYTNYNDALEFIINTIKKDKKNVEDIVKYWKQEIKNNMSVISIVRKIFELEFIKKYFNIPDHLINADDFGFLDN